MHQLGFLLFTYAAAVLHVGAGSPPFGGLGVHPHFLLLVMITAVLYFDHWSALIWAASAGLLSDGLSTGPLGVEMACFPAGAFLMQHHLRRHPAPGTVRITLSCFLMALAVLALSNTLRLLITGRSFDHAKLVLLVATTATVTALTVGGFRILQAAGRKVLFPSTRRAVSSY